MRRRIALGGASVSAVAVLVSAGLVHAGTCVCDVPTPVGCADWCEIWSPDWMKAIGTGTTDIIAGIGAFDLLLVEEVLSANANVSTVGDNIAEAFEKGQADRKVIDDGAVSNPTGSSFLMGQQTGFPGPVPGSPNEGVGSAIIKNVGSDGAPKVCNEIYTGSQSVAMVSGGKDIGRDAMTNGVVESMRVGRAAYAQGSFNDHVNGYCSLADVFNGVCAAAAPDDMQNLDVMPPGNIDRGEGMTSQMSETEKRAAQSWMNNIIGMGNYPASDYAEDTYNSDARKHFSGMNNVVAARISAVAVSLSGHIARRNKVVVVFNSDGSATADVGQQMTNASPSLAPASMTAGASDTTAACAASTSFAQYQTMGSQAVISAIDNSYSANSGAFSGFGVSNAAWHYFSYIESSNNPSAQSPAGYYGLFQVGSAALSDIGMSNLLPTQVFDPVQNATAAAAYEQLNMKSFSSNFPNGVSGVSPVFVLYGMHNMGPAGFQQIYANITQGTPLSASRLKAIQQNISPTVPLAQITGQMYWEFWKKRFGLTGC